MTAKSSDLGTDLQNILRQSYDYLTIMSKLRSTYDERLVYKTSYEEHKAFHWLRGSSSPVLTAIGFVNGRGQFSTSTESTPLDGSPKTLLLVITSATPTAVPNLVQIRPRGACGQMGEI